VRVGVTGSSGLIGRALVASLENRGDQVVRFVRPGSADLGGPVVRWDPATGTIDEGDLRASGPLDALVHLAGEGIATHRWSEAHKAAVLDSRVASTRLLAEAVTRSSLITGYFISGSAIGYYGSRGDEVLDEGATPGSGFLADVCVAWEASARPVALAGVPLAHPRTGIVLSRQGGALARQLPLFRLGLGGTLGAGDHWMSPISLRDTVQALQFLLEHRAEGPVNLVSPNPLINRDFTRALGHVLHRPTLAHVPAGALRLALGAEFADQLVLASQRVVPEALQEMGFGFLDPTIASMVHENV
jgi:uncharacterized protein (TIGR01777 family)